MRGYVTRVDLIGCFQAVARSQVINDTAALLPYGHKRSVRGLMEASPSSLKRHYVIKKMPLNVM